MVIIVFLNIILVDRTRREGGAEEKEAFRLWSLRFSRPEPAHVCHVMERAWTREIVGVGCIRVPVIAQAQRRLRAHVQVSLAQAGPGAGAGAGAGLRTPL